jgi:hypothetical protein
VVLNREALCISFAETASRNIRLHSSEHELSWKLGCPFHLDIESKVLSDQTVLLSTLRMLWISFLVAQSPSERLLAERIMVVTRSAQDVAEERLAPHIAIDCFATLV